MLATNCASLTGAAVETSALIEPDHVAAVQGKADAVEASPLLRDALAAAEVARRGIDAVRSERGEKVTLTANAGALGVRPGRTFREDGGGQFLLHLRFPSSTAEWLPHESPPPSLRPMPRRRNSSDAADGEPSLSRAAVEADGPTRTAAWRRAVPQLGGQLRADAGPLLRWRQRAAAGGARRLEPVRRGGAGRAAGLLAIALRWRRNCEILGEAIRENRRRGALRCAPGLCVLARGVPEGCGESERRHASVAPSRCGWRRYAAATSPDDVRSPGRRRRARCCVWLPPSRAASRLSAASGRGPHGGRGEIAARVLPLENEAAGHGFAVLVPGRRLSARRSETRATGCSRS